MKRKQQPKFSLPPSILDTFVSKHTQLTFETLPISVLSAFKSLPRYGDGLVNVIFNDEFLILKNKSKNIVNAIHCNEIEYGCLYGGLINKYTNLGWLKEENIKINNSDISIKRKRLLNDIKKVRKRKEKNILNINNNENYNDLHYLLKDQNNNQSKDIINCTIINSINAKNIINNDNTLKSFKTHLNKITHKTTTTYLKSVEKILKIGHKSLSGLLRSNKLFLVDFDLKTRCPLSTKARKKCRMGDSFHLTRELLRLLKLVYDTCIEFKDGFINTVEYDNKINNILCGVGKFTGLYRYKYKSVKSISKVIGSISNEYQIKILNEQYKKINNDQAKNYTNMPEYEHNIDLKCNKTINNGYTKFYNYEHYQNINHANNDNHTIDIAFNRNYNKNINVFKHQNFHSNLYVNNIDCHNDIISINYKTDSLFYSYPSWHEKWRIWCNFLKGNCVLIREYNKKHFNKISSFKSISNQRKESSFDIEWRHRYLRDVQSYNFIPNNAAIAHLGEAWRHWKICANYYSGSKLLDNIIAVYIKEKENWYLSFNNISSKRRDIRNKRVELRKEIERQNKYIQKGPFIPIEIAINIYNFFNKNYRVNEDNNFANKKTGDNGKSDLKHNLNTNSTIYNNNKKENKVDDKSHFIEFMTPSIETNKIVEIALQRLLKTLNKDRLNATDKEDIKMIEYLIADIQSTALKIIKTILSNTITNGIFNTLIEYFIEEFLVKEFQKHNIFENYYVNDYKEILKNLHYNNILLKCNSHYKNNIDLHLLSKVLRQIMDPLLVDYIILINNKTIEYKDIKYNNYIGLVNSRVNTLIELYYNKRIDDYVFRNFNCIKRYRYYNEIYIIIPYYHNDITGISLINTNIFNINNNINGNMNDCININNDRNFNNNKDMGNNKFEFKQCIALKNNISMISTEFDLYDNFEFDSFNDPYMFKSMKNDINFDNEILKFSKNTLKNIDLHISLGNIEYLDSKLINNNSKIDICNYNITINPTITISPSESSINTLEDKLKKLTRTTGLSFIAIVDKWNSIVTKFVNYFHKNIKQDSRLVLLFNKYELKIHKMIMLGINSKLRKRYPYELFYVPRNMGGLGMYSVVKVENNNNIDKIFNNIPKIVDYELKLKNFKVNNNDAAIFGTDNKNGRAEDKKTIDNLKILDINTRSLNNDSFNDNIVINNLKNNYVRDSILVNDKETLKANTKHVAENFNVNNGIDSNYDNILNNNVNHISNIRKCFHNRIYTTASLNLNNYFTDVINYFNGANSIYKHTLHDCIYSNNLINIFNIKHSYGTTTAQKRQNYLLPNKQFILWWSPSINRASIQIGYRTKKYVEMYGKLSTLKMSYLNIFRGKLWDSICNSFIKVIKDAMDEKVVVIGNVLKGDIKEYKINVIFGNLDTYIYFNNKKNYEYDENKSDEIEGKKYQDANVEIIKNEYIDNYETSKDYTKSKNGEHKFNNTKNKGTIDYYNTSNKNKICYNNGQINADNKCNDKNIKIITVDICYSTYYANDLPLNIENSLQNALKNNLSINIMRNRIKSLLGVENSDLKNNNIFELDYLTYYNEYVYVFDIKNGNLYKEFFGKRSKSYKNKVGELIRKILLEIKEINKTVGINEEFINYIDDMVGIKFICTEIYIKFNPSLPTNLYKNWNYTFYTNLCRLAMVIKSNRVELINKVETDECWIKIETELKDDIIENYCREKCVCKDIITNTDVRNIILGIDIFKNRNIKKNTKLNEGNCLVNIHDINCSSKKHGVNKIIEKSIDENKILQYNERNDINIYNNEYSYIYNKENQEDAQEFSSYIEENDSLILLSNINLLINYYESNVNSIITNYKCNINSSVIIERNIILKVLIMSDLCRPLIVFRVKSFYIIPSQYYDVSNKLIIYNNLIKLGNNELIILKEEADIAIVFNSHLVENEIKNTVKMNRDYVDANVSDKSACFIINDKWNCNFDRKIDESTYELGFPKQFFDECR